MRWEVHNRGLINEFPSTITSLVSSFSWRNGSWIRNHHFAYRYHGEVSMAMASRVAPTRTWFKCLDWDAQLPSPSADFLLVAYLKSWSFLQNWVSTHTHNRVGQVACYSILVCNSLYTVKKRIRGLTFSTIIINLIPCSTRPPSWTQ